MKSHRLLDVFKIKYVTRIFIGILVPLFSGITLSAQQLAFPSADGYGMYVTGGRGGAVIEVTNLNDDNQPGSLRYAINQSGPRTIVFRISGIIELKSVLTISDGDLTIAGQTAPGDGICIKDYNVRISASNVIVRYIRFRLGEKSWGDDALTCHSPKKSAASGSLPYKNILIDHCSVSYGSDETLTIYDVENVTIQWCIISESLNRDGHGFGGIWGGWGASFHHNLFAHHKSRAPRFCGSRYQNNLQREVNDMRYNVIYNAGKTYGGEGGHYNVVNNYYRRCRSDFCNPSAPDAGQFPGYPLDSLKSYWYVEGNYIYGDPVTTADNWNDGVQVDLTPLNIRLYDPLPSEYTGPEETAEEAFVRVMNEVGAIHPKRDSVDIRIVNDVMNGTGKVALTIADIPGDAFPALYSLPAPDDDDQDGMPNDWELAQGLDKDNPEDRNQIGQGGYTMLEVYLNTLTGEMGPDVSVNDYLNSNPESFMLYPNYPNPFNPETTIRFTLIQKSTACLNVYNTTGQEIVTLVNSELQPGTYDVRWSGNDSFGNSVPAGIYFYSLEAEGVVMSNKMLLLK